jgi:hypothetical protein
MDLMLIAPYSMLDIAEQFGDAHFVLSGVWLNREAREFFRQSKKWKLLDNGAYELGYPIPFDELLKLAEEIRANEIVCPDFFKVRDGTYEATKEFIEALTSKQRKQFKLLAVPQATSPSEWIESYKDMAKLNVDGIALPIWLQKHFKARPSVFGYLQKKHLLDDTKYYHLLGLDDYSELYAYPKGAIRSVDTSLPFSLTAANIWTTFGDVEHKRIPLDAPRFSQMQMRLLNIHLEAIREACQLV